MKKRVLYSVGVLLALAAAFGVGRFLSPEKVVEKVVEVERAVEVVRESELEAVVEELAEEIRTLKSQLTDVKKSIHRETRTVQHPSGMVETVKVEDINVSKVVKEQEIKYVDREVKTVEVHYVDRVVEKEVEKLVEKERLVTSRPDWRVSPMVGVSSTSDGWVKGNVTYGGMVERRIIGGVSIGVWGLTSGQAGVGVSFEF